MSKVVVTELRHNGRENVLQRRAPLLFGVDVAPVREDFALVPEYLRPQKLLENTSNAHLGL